MEFIDLRAEDELELQNRYNEHLLMEELYHMLLKDKQDLEADDDFSYLTEAERADMDGYFRMSSIERDQYREEKLAFERFEDLDVKAKIEKCYRY